MRSTICDRCKKDVCADIDTDGAASVTLRFDVWIVGLASPMSKAVGSDYVVELCKKCFDEFWSFKSKI